MKIITAKFRGSCLGCQQPILPGEKIEWEKGTGAHHITCPPESDRAVCPSCGEFMSPSLAARDMPCPACADLRD